VITLATPFVFTTKRKLNVSFLAGAAVGIGAVIVSVLVLAFIGANPRNLALQWWQAVLGGVALMELILLWIGMSMHGRPLEVEDREKLLLDLRAPDVAADSLLVIRAPGDEASGLLISGQFVNWFVGRLTQVSFGTVGAYTMLLSVLSMFAGLAVAFLAGPERLADSLVTVGMVGYVGCALLAFALITALMLPSLAFGIDGPFVSLMAFVTAESTPPGECSLMQLNYNPEARTKGLSHSSLYDDDAVIHAIISRANELSVPGA
jgi:hypothetical protein